MAVLATPSRLGTTARLEAARQRTPGSARGVSRDCGDHRDPSDHGIAGQKPLLLVASGVVAAISIGALAFAWAPMLFLTRNATNIFFVLDTSLVFVSAGVLPPLAVASVASARCAPVATALGIRKVTRRDSGDARRDVAGPLGALAAAVVYSSIGLGGFFLLQRRLRRTGELGVF